MLVEILGVAAAYLIGSIPFGYLVARARGVDIFQAGSGNIGATNVGRVLGRPYGLAVFALDLLKGAVPTAIVKALAGDPIWAVAAGLGAILGHLFPIYLRLRGGKGVATGFGVVAVLLPLPALAAFAVWLVLAVTTRIVSLASIAAALVLAAGRLVTTPEPFAPGERGLTGFCLLAAALVIVKHRSNIARLINGKESRLAETRGLQLVGRGLHVLALGVWFGAGVMFSLIVGPSLFATLDSRVAGDAVRPIFPIYFALQGACGLVALATAAGWTRIGRVHRLRFIVIAAALALVLAGWPIVGTVAELREARHSANPTIAEPATAAFARWHGISLGLNLTALSLTGFALALAAALPSPRITDEHDSI